MTAPVVRDTGVEQRRLGQLVAAQVPPVGPGEFERWAPAAAELVQRGGRASSTLAAREYSALRTAAAVTGRFSPVLAPPAPLEQISKSLRWATFAPGEADLDTRVQGVVQKMVMDPGRFTIADTVAADPKAVTYARVPAPGACGFCALLSTRGSVFASAQTALKTGTSDRSYHGGCRCTARPVFTGETYVPPAHVMDAEQVYIDSTGGVTGKAKLSEFRKAWRRRSTSLTS